jgi:hypothetical protein
VLISLTDKGLACYNYFNEIVDEIFESVDKNDVEDYLQSLETMVRILRKFGNQLNKSTINFTTTLQKR